MWLVLCWLIGVPKLLYHFFLTSILLILFLFYKIFGTRQASSLSRAQLQEQFEQRQRLILASGGQLRDKIKFVLMRGTRGAMRLVRRENEQPHQLDDVNPYVPVHTNNNTGHPTAERRFYLANLALVYVLLVATCWPTGTDCLEQDAAILEPVANIAKALIKTATLGEPLEISFDPASVVKNFAYFTWRTRFPVNMPRGFVQKAQDFYNRVKDRVDAAEVKDVQRKSLANLKLDLDKIVDSIVEEVRQSPDGLYTDYLQTRVNGVPLEDACVAVGIQLKAYGVDLTNYRNIAGVVLGIPVMPTVASAMVNVASMANMDTMRNLTSSLNPLNPTLLTNHLPNTARQSVSMVSNSFDSLRQQLPMQNMVQAPLTLLSSGQRFFTPQMAAGDGQQLRQPVFA